MKEGILVNLTRLETNVMKPVLLVVAIICCLLVFGGGIARAHEGEGIEPHEEASEVSEESPTSQSFEYTAQPGDSLTKLVRKSVVLYAAANSLELTQPEIMYIETNVQIDLGSKRLDVGDSVVIPVSLIEQYVPQTEQLTPAQQTAWQGYANQATFQLEEIEPVVDPVTQPAEEISDEATTVEVEANTESSSDNAQWYWWVIGGAAIVGLWYLLWRRTGDNDSE